MPDLNLHQLAADIKTWGGELGFQQVGITDIDLADAEVRLQAWLAKGYHGSMEWLTAHENKRSRPADLLPGALRVISVRMDYLPGDTAQIKILKDPTKAYVSRYALGRDYHKLIRKRLSLLAKKIDEALPKDYPLKGQNRAFVDSGPVMERPLAELRRAFAENASSFVRVTAGGGASHVFGSTSKSSAKFVKP